MAAPPLELHDLHKGLTLVGALSWASVHPFALPLETGMMCSTVVLPTAPQLAHGLFRSLSRFRLCCGVS